MRSDVYDGLADALGGDTEFDLPSDRTDFVLVAAFFDENRASSRQRTTIPSRGSGHCRGPTATCSSRRTTTPSVG